MIQIVFFSFSVAAVLGAPFGGSEQLRIGRVLLNSGAPFKDDDNTHNGTSILLCFRNVSVLDNVSLCRGFISGVMLGSGLVLLGVNCLCIAILKRVYVRKCRKRTYKQFDNDDDDQMKMRRNARLATNNYLGGKHSGKKYKLDDKPLKDMGSRTSKYWYSASSGAGHQEVVVTNSTVFGCCPLLEVDERTGKKTLKKETVDTLNEFMKTLGEHPFLHPIKEIGYLDDRQQVIIIQPFMPNGSLKDMIYGVSPNKNWDEKYSRPETVRKQYLRASEPNVQYCANSVNGDHELRCQELITFFPRKRSGLSTEEVAKYGWQILEAMVFLKNQGFPLLGHVQSGNIFVENGGCKLGGYENTLLGYRSRLYLMHKERLESLDIDIDVIMFGHLVFEMSCAYELTTIFPTDQDYQAVKTLDDGRIEKVLRYIFLPKSITQIKEHHFFQSQKMSVNERFHIMRLKYISRLFPSSGSSKILEAVRERNCAVADRHVNLKQAR